jgi:ribosome maturation factor RimP
MPGSDVPRERLLAVVRGPVAAAGLDLEDVEVRPAGRRRLVRVIVDRDGGVDLDLVAAVSGPVGEALESSGVLGAQPYVLEVSSPGVDRPLRTPVQWRRATGRLVEVALVDGNTISGRIEGADDDGVDLDLGRHGRRIGYADVRRAVVQVEFGGGDASAGSEA